MGLTQLNEPGYEFIPPTTEQERIALDAKRSRAIRNYMTELVSESNAKAIQPTFWGRLWLVLWLPSLSGLVRMFCTPSETALRFARIAREFERLEMQSLFRRA